MPEIHAGIEKFRRPVRFQNRFDRLSVRSTVIFVGVDQVHIVVLERLHNIVRRVLVKLVVVVAPLLCAGPRPPAPPEKARSIRQPTRHRKYRAPNSGRIAPSQIPPRVQTTLAADCKWPAKRLPAAGGVTPTKSTGATKSTGIAIPFPPARLYIPALPQTDARPDLVTFRTRYAAAIRRGLAGAALFSLNNGLRFDDATHCPVRSQPVQALR